MVREALTSGTEALSLLGTGLLIHLAAAPYDVGWLSLERGK